MEASGGYKKERAFNGTDLSNRWYQSDCAYAGGA